jgi:hypothetical protein
MSMLAKGGIPHDYQPVDEADLLRCLSDPSWRVCSGALYKIMVKSPDGDGETIVPFKPNRAQRRLIGRLWHRNIILKARQLGFTTLVCILWLDHALFNENQRCGIVAQDREKAKEIFRDKVRLAYDRLPDVLREAMPLKTETSEELLFEHNNSSIRVSTSLRSGTYHRLHISEFGKICAEFPKKADEVIRGSLPTVPQDGIAIIESTAEGQGGHFHSMTMRAMALDQQGKQLNERDYRFHFYAWWQEPGYTMDPSRVSVTDSDEKYFEQVEAINAIELTPGQRAWYVSTRDNDFGGDPQSMWQEYPSFPDEAFKVSTEGTYYAVQLAAARKAGRIGPVPHIDGLPVNTFWDIGSGDGTGIWLHQQIGLTNRFIGYIEGWGEPYSYFIKELQDTGYIWGTHYLPHDAEHKRQQGERVASPLDELSAFKIGGKWETVARVDDLSHGIQRTRSRFSTYYFDETGCKDGLNHLANYRKRWNKATGQWSDEPLKNGHTEAADALRQHAQGYPDPRHKPDEDDERPTRRRRNWKTS